MLKNIYSKSLITTTYLPLFFLFKFVGIGKKDQAGVDSYSGESSLS